uniref:ZP domain-containing protein n=1 Tax=Glossina pallidipes TaxID=7398 RepID=A0A1B0A498_GLOPL
MSVCFLRKDNENKTLLVKRQQSSSKLLVFALVMLVMQHFMLVSGNTPKGLRTHMRSAKLSNVHSLPEINADRTAGKYEIRSISGEPNYKSVNLTWEVEFVTSPSNQAADAVNEVELPKVFQIYFCELQTFGPHRCRSKSIDETKRTNAFLVDDKIRQTRQYEAYIDNLRMATKYRFHIRPQSRRRDIKVTGRSEIFSNEVEDFNENSNGQTIIIPTKGCKCCIQEKQKDFFPKTRFLVSAQATKCLPHASEIVVETGPYFAGKIVVDGGKCGIKGNPEDPRDAYTMRIEHQTCGSLVKPETNTVETFITVQENLGIFTHSTRRFVVVCSYQSGMQTVRASFSVPGKGGVAAVEHSNDDEDRKGRLLQPPKFVDKSELVLKENNDEDLSSVTTEKNEANETEALVKEIENHSLQANETETIISMQNSSEHDVLSAIAWLENIVPNVNEDHIKSKEMQRENENKENIAEYAKLVLNRNGQDEEMIAGLLHEAQTGKAFIDSLVKFDTLNILLYLSTIATDLTVRSQQLGESPTMIT